jgi:hypothetical protein
MNLAGPEEGRKQAAQAERASKAFSRCRRPPETRAEPGSEALSTFQASSLKQDHLIERGDGRRPARAEEMLVGPFSVGSMRFDHCSLSCGEHGRQRAQNVSRHISP